MNTLEEAQARMAECPLLRPVAVADRGARRTFTFANPGGGSTEVEIDAVPSDRQRRDLAAHLPVLERDRDVVVSIITRADSPIAEPRIPP